MEKVYSCSQCYSPWIDRRRAPVVYDTLHRLPIGWCRCDTPILSEQPYTKDELTEVYWLATSPCVLQQEGTSVIMDEDDLQNFSWVKRSEEGWYLTTKGRRLLPFTLLLAADLHSGDAGA